MSVSTGPSVSTSTAGPHHGKPLATWASRILALNVIVEALIVVTGGIVRLTGSGLGCPTWPECVPGSYTPVVMQEQGFHKWIEFGNRTLTGLVGLVALAVLVTVWRQRRRDLVPYAVAVLFGILAQAVIGGISVRLALHPGVVMTHFLVSMLLVIVSTMAWMRGREPAGGRRLAVRTEARGLAWLTAAVLAGVVVVGTVVTGSGPHSGDADEPARFGIDPQSVSWLHADLVMVFIGLLIGLLIVLRLTPATALTRRASTQLLVATLAQAAVGYVQYFTDLPWVLVAVHMAGACVLVIAMTRLLASLTVPSTVALPTTQPLPA